MKQERRYEVINEIRSTSDSFPPYIFATGNVNKLKEFAEILETDIRKLTGIELPINEIQDIDPYKVIQQKAKDAWEANGFQPIIVEDSFLSFPGQNGLPGALAKHLIRDVKTRIMWCEQAKKDNDKRALFGVLFGLYDGQEVQIREGITTGTLPDAPRGSRAFGFDDIFVPDGQEILPNWNGKPRTFSEMTLEEKNMLSPRKKALMKLLNEPFIYGKWIYKLPEPYQIQIDAINKEKMDLAEKHEQALRFAYNLTCLEGNTLNKDFSITERPAYHEIEFAPGFKRYVTHPDSSDLGIIITPWDIKKDLHDRPIRLRSDENGTPIFWQMGNEAVKMALAARTEEFLIHHNEKMYDYIRKLKSGEVKTVPRSNKRSPVLENLLRIIKRLPLDLSQEEAWHQAFIALRAVAPDELGYKRKSADHTMSRTEAANYGLIINATGIPSSIFSLGAMPPVTGWEDVVSTAALSYISSFIQRNSIYANNPEMQIRLFKRAKEKIKRIGLPPDIEEIVIKQIGISIGCDNPEKTVKEVQEMTNAGCKSFRIYTTNTDPRVVKTARLLRQKFGDEILITVGTVVDYAVAKQLIHPDIRVNKILVGHGGGENCTSLDGGGATNSLEILYRMYLDPDFNKTAIGLEGGTGNSIGALLGIVDVISLNRRGVSGGIEAGGLFVEDNKGRIVQPYHGSASPIVQWIEAVINPAIKDKRLDFAGRLKNVEGKPNYMEKPRRINSIVDRFHEIRMLAGRTLADQNSISIHELRMNILFHGHNHVAISPKAKELALDHRTI